MTLSIELLPAPFGPMIARISPWRISKLMPLSATMPPNDRRISSQPQQHVADALIPGAGGVAGHRPVRLRHRPTGEWERLRLARIFRSARMTAVRPSSKVTVASTGTDGRSEYNASIKAA